MYYKSVSAIAGGGKTAVLLNTFSKGLARCSGSNWVFFPDPNWLCAPGANNWHDDGVTRSFIKRKGDILVNPSKMSPFELSEATTYCRSVNNPYARELAIRAGIGEAYNKKRELNAKGKILKEAASTFGISLF